MTRPERVIPKSNGKSIICYQTYLSTCITGGFSLSCHGSLQLLRETHIFPTDKREDTTVS